MDIGEFTIYNVYLSSALICLIAINAVGGGWNPPPPPGFLGLSYEGVKNKDISTILETCTKANFKEEQNKDNLEMLNIETEITNDVSERFRALCKFFVSWLLVMVKGV